MRRAVCDRPSHRDRRGGCGDINEGEGNEGGMVRGPFEAKRGVLRQARGRLCNVKRRLNGRRQGGSTEGRMCRRKGIASFVWETKGGGYVVCDCVVCGVWTAGLS